MTDLCMQVPDQLTEELLQGAVAQSIEATVCTNFLWYLQSWDDDENPPCCPKCAGIRYVPNPPGSQWYVATAPVLVARGSASCESAAAMHTAHKRADGFRNLTKKRPLVAALDTPEGRRVWLRVKDAYQIRMESTGTPRYWHVVSVDEGERHDATEEMLR